MKVMLEEEVKYLGVFYFACFSCCIVVYLYLVILNASR